MGNRRTCLVWIPENFKPYVLLQTHPTEFRHHKTNIKMHADCLAYIVSLIYSIPARDKDLDLRKTCGYIQINAQILETIVRDYDQYLKFLIDYKVFESDDTYIIGKKSTGYKLLSPYAEADLDDYLITKPTLAKRLGQSPISKAAVDKYPKLYEFLKAIEIDEEGALRKARELAYEHPIPKKKRKNGKSKKETRSEKEIRDDLHISYQLSIKNLVHGKFHFNIPNSTGRLYNNVVNLKRKFRPYLSYNGKRLVSIDLKNSQPYLLSSIIKPIDKIGQQTKDVLNKIDPKALSKINYILQKTPKQSRKKYFKSSSWGKYIKLVKNKSHVSDDLRLYKMLVIQGRYYEFLMHAYKILEDLPRLPDRDQIKKQTCTFMYAKGDDVNRYSRYRLFKKLFPTISLIYSALKSEYYKNFPEFLQTLEARLILDNAYARISIEKPDLPIFTIHDSLVTTKGNEDYVEQVLSEELEKEIGEKPVLGKELWEREDTIAATECRALVPITKCRTLVPTKDAIIINLLA